ncbi:M1 family aminopeptidase, partial [Ideonella sp.]|uniref:M1 family aminopeptidase n=1 Tax=Ideonella sp. TaxID=1929293 RepID=UPI003BB53D46
PGERDGWVTHRYVQGDVHDFAFTADSRTAPPLEAKWTGPGSPEVSVRVLFPPEYAHNAPRVLKATLDSLSYFSKTLGPYPYKTVTAVIPPFNAEEAGGMEYPTFFTASSYADDEEGTMNAYQLDFVTIHEFGHGYFYGILASNEFEEPMLDEGLNEFWNLRMIRERGQAIPARTLNSKRLGLGSDVPAFDFERSFSVVGEPADPLGQNSWNRHSSASYGSVYGRTATALRDLESVLGKEVLEKAFMAYYERWKFRHPTVADLQAVLAEVSGEPAAVAGLFERHIYAAQKIDDRVDKLVSEEVLPLKGQILAEGKRTERDTEAFDALVEKTRKDWDQAHPDAAPGTGPYPWRSTVVLRRYGAAVPQTVRVTFEDGSVELAVWDNQDRWQQFSWVKASKVVSAELDPTYAHAMDTRWLDNSRSLKADRAAARRWSLEGASLFQTLFALVSTL